MKKVEIITRPFHLDEIKDVLSSIEINEIVASDIRVSGGHSNSESYLQEDYFVEFMPKIKIEFFVEAQKIAELTNTLKTFSEQEGAEDIGMYVYAVEKAL